MHYSNARRVDSPIHKEIEEFITRAFRTFKTANPEGKIPKICIAPKVIVPAGDQFK